MRSWKKSSLPDESKVLNIQRNFSVALCTPSMFSLTAVIIAARRFAQMT
ncbi:hypothetical protein C7S15_5435 [Burkholderia cepacia]|nr:hypothetical protein [Burkholderia cepacia]